MYGMYQLFCVDSCFVVAHILFSLFVVVWFLYCNTVLSVLSSFASNYLRKRDLVVLFNNVVASMYVLCLLLVVSGFPL